MPNFVRLPLGRTTTIYKITGLHARILEKAGAIITVQGKRILDCDLAAQICGKQTAEILLLAQQSSCFLEEIAAQRPVELTSIKAELDELGLISRDGKKILWQAGIEHESEFVRGRMQAICVTLITEAAHLADCPVQALNSNHFTGNKQKGKSQIKVSETDISLAGLYSYFGLHSDRKGREIIDFMLESLGMQTLADIEIEEQIAVLRKIETIPWRRIPIETQRHLIAEVAREKDCSPWYLQPRDLQKTEPVNLWQLYQYYQKQAGREQREIIDFMLEKMGFGPPPFNAIGQLAASSRAKYPLHSLHLQLQTVRNLVNIWRQRNPERQLTSVQRKELEPILRSDNRFAGFHNLFQAVNPFGYSFIDLICLAFQRDTLDVLDPIYRSAHLDQPNYLVPAMFDSHAGSKADSQRPQRITGYYSPIRSDHELPLLLRALEVSIARNGHGENNAEETFDPKWQETQARALENIMAAIKDGRPLPAPLAFALGLQPLTSGGKPLLANAALLEGIKLDLSQACAARMMLHPNNTLTLVHGPAGSGKTSLVSQVANILARSGKRVLYVTPTHKAADGFMKRVTSLEDAEMLPLLRLGESSRKISLFSKDYWVNNRSARDVFRGKWKRGSGGYLMVATLAGGSFFLSDANALLTQQYLFSETFPGGGRIIRKFEDQDVIIIDEASMASKAEMFTILSRARRAIIIGDHMQLAPFALESEVLEGLDLAGNQFIEHSIQRSLLEDLIVHAGYPHVLLDTCYRAEDPALVELPSGLFYDGRIRVDRRSPYFTLAPEDRKQRYPAEGIKLVDTSAVNLSHKREVSIESSFSNRYEARRAMIETRKLLASGYQLNDIAFISPYLAQVELLKTELRNAFPLEANEDYLARWVTTAHGVQGDENKATIVSFVCSNVRRPPRTGFVGDFHRVCVLLTRMRNRRILIGDLATLKKIGQSDEAIQLVDPLSQQTRYIFQRIEQNYEELAAEGRAVIIRPT